MRHDGRTHLSSIDQSAIKRRVTRKVDHLREDCGSGLDPERAGSDEEMPEGSVPSSMRICSISGEEEEDDEEITADHIKRAVAHDEELSALL
jgi:hypothetical protein